MSTCLGRQIAVQRVQYRRSTARAATTCTAPDLRAIRRLVDPLGGDGADTQYLQFVLSHMPNTYNGIVVFVRALAVEQVALRGNSLIFRPLPLAAVFDIKSSRELSGNKAKGNPLHPNLKDPGK